MSGKLGRFGRMVLGAAVLGALGFGATQAVAAPSERGSGAARTCHDPCDNYCTNHGYLAGKCINWQCHCLTTSFTWVPVPY